MMPHERRGQVGRRRRRRRVRRHRDDAHRQAGAGERRGGAQGVRAAAQADRRAAAQLDLGAGHGERHAQHDARLVGGPQRRELHVLAGRGEAARQIGEERLADGAHGRPEHDGHLGQRVGQPAGLVEVGGGRGRGSPPPRGRTSAAGPPVPSQQCARAEHGVMLEHAAPEDDGVGGQPRGLLGGRALGAEQRERRRVHAAHVVVAEDPSASLVGDVRIGQSSVIRRPPAPRRRGRRSRAAPRTTSSGSGSGW